MTTLSNLRPNRGRHGLRKLTPEMVNWLREGFLLENQKLEYFQYELEQAGISISLCNLWKCARGLTYQDIQPSKRLKIALEKQQNLQSNPTLRTETEPKDVPERAVWVGEES